MRGVSGRGEGGRRETDKWEMDGGNGGGDGGEKSGREGEGVSEEGRKVYFNQGRREGEGACNLFWYMYVRKPSSSQRLH